MKKIIKIIKDFIESLTQKDPALERLREQADARMEALNAFLGKHYGKKIYSGFFMSTPTAGVSHVTWEFKPDGGRLPAGMVAGEEVLVVVVGDYVDDDVTVEIVQVHLSDGVLVTHQPGGLPLHITVETRNGVSPVQSGIRAQENGWLVRSELDRTAIKATAGFYRV